MAQNKTLFMETTDVPAERTASEISALLIQAGARQIATDYDAGKIRGLRWTMRVPAGGDLLFAMPVRVEPIFKLLYQRASSFVDHEREARLRAQAERVAWRQLFRWTQAQIAMVQAGMAEASEVFLPYWLPTGGDSLFQLLKGSQFKALPAPQG